MNKPYAIRKGKWKALKQLGQEEWELYHLETDRTEQHNIASNYPELVNESWNQWATSHLVLPKKKNQ